METKTRAPRAAPTGAAFWLRRAKKQVDLVQAENRPEETTSEGGVRYTYHGPYSTKEAAAKAFESLKRHYRIGELVMKGAK